MQGCDLLSVLAVNREHRVHVIFLITVSLELVMVAGVLVEAESSHSFLLDDRWNVFVEFMVDFVSLVDNFLSLFFEHDRISDMFFKTLDLAAVFIFIDFVFCHFSLLLFNLFLKHKNVCIDFWRHATNIFFDIKELLISLHKLTKSSPLDNVGLKILNERFSLLNEVNSFRQVVLNFLHVISALCLRNPDNAIVNSVQCI